MAVLYGKFSLNSQGFCEDNGVNFSDSCGSQMAAKSNSQPDVFRRFRFNIQLAKVESAFRTLTRS